MKKIVLILPTYNERDNIASLIDKIQDNFRKIKGYKSEILVVDDNSPDGTIDVVKESAVKYKNITYISGKKKGLGFAYVKGMRYAVSHMNADILFEMDADFSHNPDLIPKFIDKINAGADFVIGSRYIKGGSIPKEWGAERKMFSIFGNLIARLGLMILKVKDWTSGYRAVKREVFNTVDDQLEKYSGYTFQIAFLHRVLQKGFKVAEIPLNFTDRKWGKSKFIPTDYIINSLLYIFHNSSFIKFVIVGSIGFIIQTIISKILITVHFHPGIAVVFGAEAAIISNFFFNQFWTFSYKKITGRKKLFTKFISFNGTSVGAIAIQGIAVTLGTGVFGEKYWFIIMVISIIFLVIPYSYYIYHNIIWKDHPN